MNKVIFHQTVTYRMKGFDKLFSCEVVDYHKNYVVIMVNGTTKFLVDFDFMLQSERTLKKMEKNRQITDLTYGKVIQYDIV